MSKPYISLQPSEAVVFQAAAQMYASYVVAGLVPDGAAEAWMKRAIRDAVMMARSVDDAIQSDDERV